VHFFIFTGSRNVRKIKMKTGIRAGSKPDLNVWKEESEREFAVVHAQWFSGVYHARGEIIGMHNV
jgi:hypothetical protein